MSAFNEETVLTVHHWTDRLFSFTTTRDQALRFSNEMTDDVSKLVELHLRFHGYGSGEWTDSAVRRYVRDAGAQLTRLHKLTRADCTTRNRRRAIALQRSYDSLEARIAELAAQEELEAIRPDLDGTSQLSGPLRFGEIHPRTLLADLGDERGHEVFRKEICWREFYADVLFHNPHTIDGYYAERFANMRYEDPGENFKAWCVGRTGYPFVDAAMRQLLTTGWMHNRTRMVVASFLVKDLHIEWQHGANFFMEHLVDYDPASNSHGWQWTAGCGTDASPYYRVFNPTEQAKKFDPNGDYIRKFVPELKAVPNELIHEPGLSYIAPIVDHKVERVEALARLEEIKG